MIYLFLSFALLFVGFIAGIVFERKNSNKVEKAIIQAEVLRDRGKALLDALKGR